jgi:CRISPR-associated protein Csx10
MSAITFTLLQPSQVGAGARSDAVLGTLTYIPGAVVRGALAASWIALHGVPAPGTRGRTEFLGLFEGGVRYGPLFAGGPFMALSVLSHKYQAKDGCRFSALDEAVHGASGSECDDCGSPLEPTTRLEVGPVLVRRRTSVAIGAHGVAVRGQLFSRDSLAPQDSQGARSAFTGHIVAGHPAQLEALAALSSVRIGGRRTTHGLAQVAIDPTSEVEVPQRLDESRLVLRLRSPGVFVDDWGSPARDPNTTELRAALGSETTIEARWVRWQTIGGWHVASGLPKATELAVAPGSTYVVRTASPVTDDALRELGRRGLGLRRHEGFGDLGSAPTLPPGRLEREAEETRIRHLTDAVRPLLELVKSKAWPVIVGVALQHADGNEAATTQLTALAARLPERRPAHGLSVLLGYDRADAAAVLANLGVR